MITPEFATNILSVVGTLATSASIFVVRKFPRRFLLIPGFCLVGTCFGLVALCDVKDADIGALMLIIFGVAGFFILNQPTAYLYMYEVGMDATLGICKLAMFTF